MDASDSPPHAPAGRHEPVWRATSEPTDHDPLETDLRVDTAVVVGGIAGITTAAKLDEASQIIAVLKRDRILDGVTGHTTAKVTSLYGLVYDDPVAVYRGDEGEVHARSAVCPHMGCLVSWNDGVQSWDCPCHGSRFDIDGLVLDTPAVDGLNKVSLPEMDDRVADGDISVRPEQKG